MLVRKIYQCRLDFRNATRRNPNEIHMCQHSLNTINSESIENATKRREKELIERARPDLLPPIRFQPDVSAGDSIYGMKIIVDETIEPGNFKLEAK